MSLVLAAALVAATPVAASAVAACSWDRPGHNPFTGDLVAAVDRYRDIPAPVRATLKARMAARQYDEIVSIRRDRIEGRARYHAELRDMHFGTGQVCGKVTRARWTDSAQERGLVYCESGHCLLVPTVCRNLSRITRQGPAVAAAGGEDADGADAGGGGGGAGGPGGGGADAPGTTAPGGARPLASFSDLSAAPSADGVAESSSLSHGAGGTPNGAVHGAGGDGAGGGAGGAVRGGVRGGAVGGAGGSSFSDGAGGWFGGDTAVAAGRGDRERIGGAALPLLRGGGSGLPSGGGPVLPSPAFPLLPAPVPAPVPEPASALMLLAGLGVVGAWLRRRRPG